MAEQTPDYRKQAAAAAVKHIRPHQVIGLGAGSTMAHLAGLLAEDVALADTLVLTSSSFKTQQMLLEKGFNVKPPAFLARLDSYFDGCDQFDALLNAMKSGGGVHTTEKILAAMADRFILLGSADKQVEKLDGTYPLVVEVLPPALPCVQAKLQALYPESTITLRITDKKDGALISDYGNYLLDVRFAQLPGLQSLNETVGMLPGVVEHSLFYRLATGAIVAGPDGVRESGL
ncbi:MAG: ribose 5-phosphate isomerase A [Mucilaginibacter polytrichastri]|nr:ribose 5-phosphate isomerase A [Mucilaginibacter polytrichastri]